MKDGIIKDEYSPFGRSRFYSGFHSCYFNELNELKFAGNLNYVEKNNNKKRIEYLRTKIKLLII